MVKTILITGSTDGIGKHLAVKAIMSSSMVAILKNWNWLLKRFGQFP